ncbi:hypothetical protein FNV43_RR12871 [Rhamnella rubrinervis]|uniref:Uncharacterized protein n=1 Tax=Rhamnella rubrinervis TaxID=2594499 RepID=A0A8K0H045_9ROSA|nr:hypothetical protein FNV43_RR12871 [Rhamnella rubrinervis]
MILLPSPVLSLPSLQIDRLGWLGKLIHRCVSSSSFQLRWLAHSSTFSLIATDGNSSYTSAHGPAKVTRGIINTVVLFETFSNALYIGKIKRPSDSTAASLAMTLWRRRGTTYQGERSHHNRFKSKTPSRPHRTDITLQCDPRISVASGSPEKKRDRTLLGLKPKVLHLYFQKTPSIRRECGAPKKLRAVEQAERPLPPNRRNSPEAQDEDIQELEALKKKKKDTKQLRERGECVLAGDKAEASTRASSSTRHLPIAIPWRLSLEGQDVPPHAQAR